MSVFNRRLRSTLLAGTALTLAAIAVPKQAYAATDNFTGATNGNYNTGSNYDTTNAPGAPDTAVFGNGGAGQPNITFTTATNNLTTLSFTGTTAYTFAITNGQSLNPTASLITSDSLNATFNLSGTGSMAIGSLSNSNAGGETFATTGSGAVTITGAASIGISTLTYTGNAATVGGAFTSAGGTLSLSGVTSGTSTLGSLAGSGTVALGATTLSVGALGTTTTYSGAITGTGGNLTLTGGNLTLSGANTYTGATTVNNATLTAGVANAISTSSGLTMTAGTFALNGFNQTLGSLTGNTASTVALGANSLTVTGGTTTFAGAITGAGGTLSLTGGTLSLTGANTYTGATTITAGTLNALVGSVASSSNIVDNSLLQLSTTPAATYAGNITGTGSLQATGGAVTLSGAGNTFTGGTSITAGSLTLGANNAAGAGALAVGGGTTFAMAGFNQSVTALTGAGAITSSGGALTENSGTYTGNATSTGTLTKLSTGASVLDGTNTFSSTNDSGGSLEVGDAAHTGATLAGNVTVEQTATLLGHGTINGNVVSTGTVQPGGTIGTLTVNGNYTSLSGSTLGIELNPTTTSLLAVSGTAGLAGTLAIAPDAGTYTTGTQYTIVTAGGGISGKFASVTDTAPNIIFAETYYPGSVVLTAVNLTQAYANETPNERNFTGAAESALRTAPATLPGFTSGIANLLGTIQTNATSAQVADALGELRADSATMVLASSSAFQNFLVERMSERQGQTSVHTANSGLPGTFDVAMNDSDMPLFGPSDSQPITNDGPSVWVHGYGVLSNIGGESGFANVQSRTGGIAAGADKTLGQASLIGVAVAYEHTDYNLAGDTDENNIDTYRASLYGSTKLDPVPLTLDGAVSYAFNDYHNTSFLPLFTGGGFSQTSRHDGNTLTGDAGLSHAFAVPQNVTTGKLTLVPRVGVEYDNIQQNAFTTTGAPVRALDLQTNGSTLNALRSTVGGKADLELHTPNGTAITPEVRASYLHDFMDTNVALTESFTGAGAAGFNISGVRPGRDAALAGGGVTVAFKDNVSVDISYDADVRNHELDNVIQAGVKYKW